MIQKVVVAWFLLLLIPLTAAAISIEEVDQGSVIISELDNPAVFDFVMTNDGAPDTIEIFSLVGVSFSPRGTFELPTGTTTLNVRAYPSKDIRKISGPYIFEYQLKGKNGVVYKDTLQIRIVKLADAFAVQGTSFKPGDTALNVGISNTQNTYIDNLKITLRSEFFEHTQVVSLAPFASQNVSVQLDQAKTAKLPAGKYIMSALFALDSTTMRIDSVLNYLEQQDLSLETISKGLIVRQTMITKRNEGNIAVRDSITQKRDVLTRLFTSYSLEPASAVRRGLAVNYSWERELAPGESWTLTSTTNYTLPFILVILIIVVVVLVQQHSRTSVKVQKSVSFVRTKGGEFALKVRITVKARGHSDNVQVIDRLPGMTKLYEKFGTKPDKIDPLSRRLFWNFDKLQAGEERVISYILYSTIKVIGRYELPPTLVLFEHKGQTHEQLSNRVYFVSDTVSRN